MNFGIHGTYLIFKRVLISENIVAGNLSFDPLANECSGQRQQGRWRHVGHRSRGDARLCGQTAEEAQGHAAGAEVRLREDEMRSRKHINNCDNL
jgi:hypothetical protein